MRLTPQDITPDRLEVTTVDPESGEECPVALLGTGRCHLLGRFHVQDRTVQFRLDWGARDSNGHPIMDADFIDTVSGTHLRSASLKPFHHTKASDAKGQRYEWRYRDVTYRFEIRVYWLGAVSQTIRLRQHVRGDVVDGHA